MKKIIAFLAMLIVVVIILPSCTQADEIQVQCTWTAPGDDGNVGTAAQYEMRWCQDDSMLLINDFWNQNRIPPDSLPSPSIAGTIESITITIDVLSGHYFYIAVMARDEANNWSGLSNIKEVYYEYIDVTAPNVIIDFEVILVSP